MGSLQVYSEVHEILRSDIFSVDLLPLDTYVEFYVFDVLVKIILKDEYNTFYYNSKVV